MDADVVSFFSERAAERTLGIEKNPERTGSDARETLNVEKMPEIRNPPVIRILNQSDEILNGFLLTELATYPIVHLIPLMIEAYQETLVLLKLLSLINTDAKIQAVAELPDGKALLISCMGNDDWQVRARVIQVLSKIPSKWATKLIHNACMDYDIRVRMQAIEVVRQQFE